MKCSLLETCLYALLLAVLASCSQADKSCHSLADTWNAKCPIALGDDGIDLTGVRYSEGEFILTISLGADAPTSVQSLRMLNDEYSRRMQMMADYSQNGKETGSIPFVKGVLCNSPVITQLVDSIGHITSSNESTQGFLPLVINVSDGIDSLSCYYNEEWKPLSDYEWLNAIMPVEMSGWPSDTGQSLLPSLNEIVKVTGPSTISKDGILNIYCSYDADPAYSPLEKPVSISDIKGEYFSKSILEKYVADRIAENEDIYRFLNACAKRGIRMQFVVKGYKDAIDYDLATPEFIKSWESWGGSDSIMLLICDFSAG